ncbi:hypothetical protein RSOLAG1IB_10370 [Rhizoctonia solani AG-1 IB]|uniref:Uncharacterized protein n=1 Tax=Thanatephorus cucumeris (strain AG1-IB / isolate 7/3/14) TaxID=1108050 RepID=A0A0B7FWG7_THACB|nr:hypothetical protein RSOLAG1IB_10370 [Rhizoctonia solani AG-1 IB]
MLCVFAPLGLPNYTISLRRLRASPFSSTRTSASPKGSRSHRLGATYTPVFFSDTPTHRIRPGVGRPPELARWHGPAGTPVRRTVSLAPALPSSGPSRLILAFYMLTPQPQPEAKWLFWKLKGTWDEQKSRGSIKEGP